ncbi:hypothetical protein [Flavobacterium chungangensis]|uniref:N-acetyltransferase domain-containing protein n=1 Tax=Flavobacterium chungangensis TaxID=2708132 RepID=A0ABV8ZKD6_9FLAO
MTQQHIKISQDTSALTAANANQGSNITRLQDNRQHTIVQQKLSENTTTSDLPIQRAVKDATVTWGVTHIVKLEGDSLFGNVKGDALSNELKPSEGGQLKKGDILVIDDAPVFISRRGSNQENSQKRKEDRKGEKIYEWVQVLEIIHKQGPPTIFSRNEMYVRKETIQIQEKLAQKETIKNEIELANIEDWEKEDMPKEIAKIALLWGNKGRHERRRSLGVISINKKDREKLDKGSGRHWEQEDDGWDVAKDMAYEKHEPESGKKQWRIKAVVKGTNKLVGVLIVEERDESPLYLRWMIGNPNIKGGGTALLAAVKILLQSHDTAKKIDVISAYTAKESYTKAGFVVAEDDETEDHEEHAKEDDKKNEHKKGEEFNLTLSKDDSRKTAIPEEYRSFKPKPYKKVQPNDDPSYLKDKKELDEEDSLEETMKKLGLHND